MVSWGHDEVARSEELKNDLIKISRRSADRGWSPGTSGNLSVLNRDKMEVYIKVSGSSMMDLEIGNILTLDLDGNITGGEGQPSKEVNFHLGIYKNREDVGAVLHVHAPFATAFATAGIELPIITIPAKTVLKKVPVVEYIQPGSAELAKRVVESFKDQEVRSLLLKGHGLVSVGKTIYEAYHITEWTENAAKVVFLTHVLEGLNKIFLSDK